MIVRLHGGPQETLLHLYNNLRLDFLFVANEYVHSCGFQQVLSANLAITLHKPMKILRSGGKFLAYSIISRLPAVPLNAQFIFNCRLANT